MQNLILSIGRERINDNKIINNRYCFNLENILETKELSEINLIEFAINEINKKLKINLNELKREIIQRDNKEGFYLNWHIDDCAIYKHNNTENKKNNIPINDKYSLYHENELPKYTMIIYLTSIDEDFKGGEFEFVNKLIKPKKYDVIFFDSREVHRVRRFRGGTRRNILVKFYEIK